MRLLLLTLALAACATRAVNEAPVPLGYTVCGEDSTRIRPVAFIRLDALASEEGPQILAHETSHIATARHFASCKEYNEYMNKGDNRVRGEARAFCASAQVWSRQNLITLEAAIRKYAHWLSLGYPQYKLTHEQAIAMISEGCQ